jgi:hypothetical protein
METPGFWLEALARNPFFKPDRLRRSPVKVDEIDRGFLAMESNRPLYVLIRKGHFRMRTS